MQRRQQQEQQERQERAERGRQQERQQQDNEAEGDRRPNAVARRRRHQGDYQLLFEFIIDEMRESRAMYERTTRQLIRVLSQAIEIAMAPEEDHTA